MEEKNIVFADADSPFEDAQFVILGVPFDGTCSFRKGTSLGPKNIREESYNLETYLFEHDVDLEAVPFHDSGDINLKSVEDMVGGVGSAVERILSSEKIPIILGGEHSLSPPAVRKFRDVGVVILDAHLDFRNEYLGEHNSHACAARRISELVGIENVNVLGARSMEKKEMEEAKELGLNYVTGPELKKIGMKKVLEELNWERIYLSLDMDFFDPSYAPGIGNPEYFGFSPEDAKECIDILAPRMVGFDICETSPPYDNGNTASLAARLVREVIGSVWKTKVDKYKDKYMNHYLKP
jgi:agmatinase